MLGVARCSICSVMMQHKLRLVQASLKETIISEKIVSERIK
jgi:hypothetical protein